MEPNKFEENIRTKFEEREIQPSAEAWSKLEARLGAPKSSNKTLWFAIAASLITILVVGSFLLKEDKTVSNDIVEQSLPAETLNETELATSEESNVVENAVAEDKNEAEIKSTSTKALPKKTEQLVATTSEKRKDNIKKTEKGITNGTNAEVAQATVNSKTKEAATTLKKEDFISLKVDEVVAQVTNLKGKNNAVTAEDVEHLLQKAQRDIANQRLLKEATTTIDPASLLNDVETELERSFRDKVFDALGEGFNVIRTAMVERNN